MPPLIPINKIKQWKDCCNQLTTVWTSMTGASQTGLKWGRRISTNSTVGSQHTQCDLVAQLTPEPQAIQSDPEYTCITTNSCYGGIWEATNPGATRGLTRDGLMHYYDEIDGNASYYLLKGTPDPRDSSPSPSPDSCSTNTYNEAEMWGRVIPVEHEYIVFIPNQAGISSNTVGNWIDPLLAGPPANTLPTDAFYVLTDFEIFTKTGIPTVLQYLRMIYILRTIM
jgi:hypothetical protein